ncbi:MAG: alpha/beta hydrolase [Hyphomicrobiales bacterium]|nr:alpha/beta hydrolase [Hyphomicrobiales bacterium]
MVIFRFLLVIAAVLLLPACSAGGRIMNALQPDEGVSVERGMPYGSLARQKYDLYSPANATPDAPVIVFIYGGSWHSGSRKDYEFVGEALARGGFITAIADYRLYPEVIFPAFVEDEARAVAAIAKRVGAKHPLFIMGHSAGAEIGALLVLDPHYLKAEGVDVCRRVSGFIGLAGPYAALPLHRKRYRRIFPENVRAAAIPVNFAAGKHPPSLLIAGKSDLVVDPDNTANLAKALKRAGNRVEVSDYRRVGHMLLVGSLAKPLHQFAPTLREIKRFVGRESRLAAPFCGR